MSIASAVVFPLAMIVAYRQPALQPTNMSMPMPARFKTLMRPSDAAHLTLPDPITTATPGDRAAS